MTREPSQTAENPTSCIGHPVPTIERWDAGNGLETKKDCCTIYHTIDSDSAENFETALIDEFEENLDSWKSFLETEIPIKDTVAREASLQLRQIMGLQKDLQEVGQVGSIRVLSPSRGRRSYSFRTYIARIRTRHGDKNITLYRTVADKDMETELSIGARSKNSILCESRPSRIHSVHPTF